MIKAGKIRPGKEYRILFFCAFLWLIFCAVTIRYIHGISILPDEYGYWAQASKMAGYDWSMVSAQQRYYSFGYGFILMPILRLIHSAEARYRLAVLLQFAGMALSGFLLYGIFAGKRGERTEEEKKKAAAASGVTMLYAAYMVYAQTTMAETCLTLLFLLIVYKIKGYLAEPSLKKALVLCLLSIWLYTVHMRTVGIVFVCFLTMISGLAGKETKKGKKAAQLTAAVLFFVILAAGAVLYKERYTDGLAVGNVIYNNVTNDYAGQVGKVKYFFSIRGFGNFIVSLTGKIFYGLSASFGIFFWGMLAVWQKVWDALTAFRAHKRPDGEQLFYVFLFLAASAMLFVSALASIYPGRLDGLIYGRYYEFMLPCVLYVGMEKMLRTKRLKEGTACWIVFQFLAFFITRGSIVANDIREVARHSVIGVGYAFYFFGNRVLYIMLAIYMAGCLLGIGTALWIRYIGKTKRYGGLFLIAALQIAIAGISSVKMVMPANKAFQYGTEMTQEILEGIEEEDRRPVAYHPYNMKEADRLQFFLKESSVYVVPDGRAFNDAALKRSDFVFVDKIYWQEELMENEEERLEAEKAKESRQEDMEALSNAYDTVTETTSWLIYYNRAL